MLAEIAGRDWPTQTLSPSLPVVAMSILLVPSVVAFVAMVPQLGRAGQALRAARQGLPRRPRVLRLLPVLVGAGLATMVILTAIRDRESGNNMWLAPYLLGGVALLGIGLLVAVPWLVRRDADLLVRSASRPAALIAGRRLQAQPAGVTRIVAGLLIGLFLVTGSRAVVVAFEDSTQYQRAALAETTGQIAQFNVGRSGASALTQLLTSDPRVAEVRTFARVPDRGPAFGARLSRRQAQPAGVSGVARSHGLEGPGG